jgi:hypothetical protein
MSILPLRVDLLEWAESFQSTIKSRITIPSIQICGLELENGIEARVSIAGQKDVRQTLKELARNKRYELEKLTMSFFQESDSISIHLGAHCAAKVEDDQFEEFLPLLRRSIPKTK